ncbi:MAG: polysaccharide biosynthesis C-terminal domain-containing protein [Ferruginibacter sp.]
MGIIQKQGVRSSVFLMIGFVIGGINLLFLFPKIFTQEEIGLTRALIDAGTVLSVLATLGSIPVIYKFYPFYKSHSPEKNDLAFRTGLICLAGFIAICLVGFIFNDFIVRKLGKSPLFAQNVLLVYPLTFLMLAFTWMEGFGWALKKTVATNFLKETFVRILTTILILMAWAGIISKGHFINLFSIIYLLPVIILFIILIRTKKWTFTTEQSKVTRRFKGKMFTFGLFVFGATFLNIASRTVDSFMIIGLKGLAQTAIFTYAAYMSAFMDLPLRSINSIATPIISESWKDKNYTNIATVYRKSTITLLVTGLFIFLIALLNIKNLVAFLGTGWEQVPAIFLIMGIAKLIDLGTGVNGQIIATSSNWRFDFYTNVLLTVLALPLNFFLIQYFGIIGAAFSNLTAITIFNAVRFNFIYRKYGWQPYGFAHIKILLVSLTIFIAVYAVPFIINIYIDTIFRSVLFAGLYVPAMLSMNVSEEFNLTARNIIRRVTGKR